MVGRAHYLAAIGFFALLSGCSGFFSPGSRLPYHQQMAPLPSGSTCRVAVLPFVSEDDYPLADSIAYKVFLAQFSTSTNYHLPQEGDILKVYQQLRILPGQEPTPEQLRLLASRLEAQLLVTGSIFEMRENPGEQMGVNPVLAVNLQIRDGKNGDVLWNTYHRRQGADYRTAMHFGTLHTVTGLSQQVAREIINLWFKEGLRQCDVSSRF
ncbi:MAG: hypothetical protein IH614_16110 [Desulfuromonadales bacterium]|nr:hypothetical protein [Desulfuromonadales bacterium]